ncbi:MAG TPA: NAD(P)-binding domain-containing protein [Acidimicrobiia bacterium]|nr:NAD(P)-binding domain-containing protein [Acidimicrobiia bacterium]
MTRTASVPAETTSAFDVVVVGGSLAGLSVAIQAQEVGLPGVLILEPGEAVALPEVVGHHALQVQYQQPLRRLAASQDGGVLVETPTQQVAARAVLVALAGESSSPPPDFPLPDSLDGRLHLGPFPTLSAGSDVLVVGDGEEAADTTIRLVGSGASVVLCLAGTDLSNLSRLARRQLLRIEAERRATILWNSQPDAIEDVGGYPMVYFDDRRTPDLQFDHVVFRLSGGEASADGSTLEFGPLPGEAVFWLGPPGRAPGEVEAVSAGEAWERIRAGRFPEIPAPPGGPRVRREDDQEEVEQLRQEHYNATITTFERAHSDLWLLRIRPDRGDLPHLAGQYASLGLGYWEPRADGARDRNLEKMWDRLVRRSYSISSPILDERGYLVDPVRVQELEFYVVLVPPSEERIPALTPRLALKRPGDRIYLGPKVAGRYTLAPVTDPTQQVVFLATGTGEAPHNSMILELFRKGHFGPIVSVVSVRYWADLAYRAVHETLEKRFPNFSYVALVTREPGVPKRYVQDLLLDGSLGELDPANSHVYACGNPAMIGLPEPDTDPPRYPEPPGVCEILTEAGFTLDRRGRPGNIHYEEYW